MEIGCTKLERESLCVSPSIVLSALNFQSYSALRYVNNTTEDTSVDQCVCLINVTHCMVESSSISTLRFAEISLRVKLVRSRSLPLFRRFSTAI